jgi:hypothetical protein
VTSTETARQVAELLEAVANGTRDAAIVLGQGPDLEGEPNRVLTSAWHHLQHFADDELIRSSDREYDRAQRDVLLRYARDIRRVFDLDDPA